MDPEELLEKNYKLAGGRKSFDFASIMEFFLKFLSDACPTTRAKAWARLFPEATKKMLANGLMDSEEFDVSPKDAKTLADAGHKTFLATPNGKIDAIRPQP